ncbi:MAG: NAD(P)-dependent oxidoreductase [Acetobacteraceae bacterium]
MSTEDVATPTVGFVGLGAIGHPIAKRICNAGYPVVVYDIRAEAMRDFQGRAELATSPLDLADRVDVVLGCLASSESFRDAILGPRGIAAAGRVRAYVHLGTNGAAVVRELATELARRGMSTLDAPMTGGRLRARDGTLTVMASGARAAFDKAEPLLRCYASKIVYIDDRVGSAQVLKAVNNVLSLTNLAAACEALLVGSKAGLDPEMMLDIINSGSGQNSATLTKIPEHVLPRSFDFGGSLAIAMKDLAVFMDQAAELGVATPVGAAVRQCYAAAVAAGSGRGDITDVIGPMEKLAGIELRSLPPVPVRGP